MRTVAGPAEEYRARRASDAEAHISGGDSLTADRAALERFSRESLAAELAARFDALGGARA